MKRTKQSIFNTVAKHLLKQNKKSEGHGACLYRGPNGLKCAIGFLIQDIYYNNKMECQTIRELSRQPGLSWMNRHKRILKSLQILHDTTEPSEWRRGLRLIAKQYGLTWKA